LVVQFRVTLTVYNTVLIEFSLCFISKPLLCEAYFSN